MGDHNYKWSDLFINELKKTFSPDEEPKQHEPGPGIEQLQLREPVTRDQLLKEIRDQNNNNSYYESAWEELAEKFPVLHVPKEKPFIKANFVWISVAAGLFLVMTIGSFYLLYNTKRATNKLPPLSTIKPATGNIILTLANGRIIDLTPNSPGVLETIDGIRISMDTMGSVNFDNTSAQPVSEALTVSTLTTMPGHQVKCRLEDGSRILLNTASSLKFPLAFSSTERRIEIKGEAFFEVAKDPAVPFFVLTGGDIKVQSIGTAFNISSYDNTDFRTTLISGKIKVMQGGESQTLKPGDQAFLDSKRKIQVVRNTDLNEVIDWTKNEFFFTNRPLREVMDKIGRWYGYEVVFAGPVPTDPISGKLSRTLSLNDLIAALEQNNNIVIKIERKKLIVTPK